MAISVDSAYKSLNKHTEVLCGDKVEILQTEDSHIMILADGMGSGVKANILATLTSKILGTMFLNGASLEDCVKTVVETLPICQVRNVAYATFSILQVHRSGEAYLVEFDNPSCIFIRNGKLMEIPQNPREIEGKTINEFRFQVQKGDAFLLMSDGTIHAGVGQLLNFGWLWEDIASYAVKQYPIAHSAMRFASVISQACNELYDNKPGDDTTVACMKIIDNKPVHLMTGPASKKEDDATMIHNFLSGDESTKYIISGGTSATIASRILDRELGVTLDYLDPDIPPIAYLEGVDLVTEGVLTLNRVIQLLAQYDNPDTKLEEFFLEIDKKNGASMIAKILIEDCTELHLYIGRAINEAYQNPNLPFDLGIRQRLVDQLKESMEKLGKIVTITYY